MREPEFRSSQLMFQKILNELYNRIIILQYDFDNAVHPSTKFFAYKLLEDCKQDYFERLAFLEQVNNNEEEN